MDKAPTQKARVSVGVSPSDSPIYARFGQTIDVRIEKGVGPAILLRVEENGRSGGFVIVMPNGSKTILTWDGENLIIGGQSFLPTGVNLDSPAGVL